MVLDVNINPEVSSFAYYSFPLSIISAHSKIDTKFAEFEITQTVNDKFYTLGNIHQENKKWIARADDKYLENCNACIYRTLEDNDYIELEIDYQQYSNAWSAINIFVASEDDDLLVGDEKFLFRYGHFLYNGISLCKNGQRLGEPFFSKEKPVQLLVKFECNLLSFFVVGKKTEIAFQTKITPQERKNLVIGVQVKNNDNMYYKWFYQNYLQISCDLTNRDRRLEFYYGIQKHWEQTYYNYFLEYNKMNFEDVKKLGGIKYIKQCIERESYVEVYINQRYIPTRTEYGKLNHFHQNLVYGFSDKEHVFYLVGYSNSGKIQKQIIRYSDMKASLEEWHKKLIVVTYKQDAYFYEFNPDYVREVLKEYLAGYNSQTHLRHLLPKEERVFGIKVYDELMSDAGIERMISDRRIAHLLWEHKKIMIERIQYLGHLNIIKSEDAKALQEAYSNIADEIYNMKNLFLKYQIRPEKKDNELIQSILNKVKTMETDCLNQLLECWMEGN